MPLYGAECTKGIAVSSSRWLGGGGKRPRKRAGARVLIRHRPLRGPFRILDQRESYANSHLYPYRVFGSTEGRREETEGATVGFRKVRWARSTWSETGLSLMVVSEWRGGTWIEIGTVHPEDAVVLSRLAYIATSDFPLGRSSVRKGAASFYRRIFSCRPSLTRSAIPLLLNSARAFLQFASSLAPPHHPFIII